ncbi:unnamed protein product [Ambrosiozyma monospora]|uniref:Unnamed protein product n=1 Tax=Ambrosiozyma monospora TaxID=43982 RepID=A0ACB5U556_AMBMO|nr:unnamed protein product [Ambrosiozyma monospora]
MSILSHFTESYTKQLSLIKGSDLHENGKYTTDQLYQLIIDVLIYRAFAPPPFQYDTNDKVTVLVSDQENPVVLKDFSMNGIKKRMVSFEVLAEKLSFLHPLHSMFSYLVEADPTMNTPQRLKQLFDMINMTAQNIGFVVSD